MGQHFGIDAAKILYVLPKFVCGESSAGISISQITMFDSYCEFFVLVSANIGWYCTKISAFVIPKIPVFGSYQQFENLKYQYISNRLCLILILPKHSIVNRAVHIIRFLAIEIVGTTKIQFKAKANALTFIC